MQLIVDFFVDVVVVTIVVDSSPLLPHLILTIIANFFMLIVVSYLLLASIGDDGSFSFCFPPNRRQWHHHCHHCRSCCAPLLFQNASLRHIIITAGTILTISRGAVLFFDMFCNGYFRIELCINAALLPHYVL
jgi:hypothetical protein